MISNFATIVVTFVTTTNDDLSRHGIIGAAVSSGLEIATKCIEVMQIYNSIQSLCATPPHVTCDILFVHSYYFR